MIQLSWKHFHALILLYYMATSLVSSSALLQLTAPGISGRLLFKIQMFCSLKKVLLYWLARLKKKITIKKIKGCCSLSNLKPK